MIIQLKKLGLLAMTVGFCFSTMACSDDTVRSDDEDNPSGWGDVDIDDPNQRPEEPEEGWQVVLVPSMVTDVEMARKSTTKLRVMLVSISDDETISEGVANKMISWGVTEGGNDLVALRSASTFTDNNGIAEVILGAKDLEGSTKVVARYAQAPKPVSFNVKVAPLPTGSMRAYATYNGFAPIKNYSIRLYDTDAVPCDTFDPKYLPEAEPLVKEDASSALFDNLSTEGEYSLVAYGYAENGAVVAAGCTQAGTTILANQTVEAFVPMSTIDLDPVSTYHVRSYFDFGDIVKSLGSVGSMITMITDFVDDPGGELYGYLMDAIKTGLSQVIPSSIAGGVTWAVKQIMSITGLETKLKDYVNDLVETSQTGCKIGLFGCQLRNIVRTMELTGDLDIQKNGALQLSGNNAYDGLSVYWRIGCETSTDPNCGRLHYSLKQLNLGTKVNALEGVWAGSLSNGYDRVSIESHDLSMYYGKIVIYLIQNVLLPKIANGASNFQDAISYWINCDSVSTWLSDKIDVDIKVWKYKLPKETAYKWCGSAAGAMAKALNFVSSMEQLEKLNSNVAISGSALMHDTSADNVVDIIDSGNWAGNMTLTTENDDGTKSTTSTAVNGVWSAYNAKNKEKDYCTFPKTSTDSDDQICSYPLVDTSSLVTSNMCTKFSQKCGK